MLKIDVMKKIPHKIHKCIYSGNISLNDAPIVCILTKPLTAGVLGIISPNNIKAFGIACSLHEIPVNIIRGIEVAKNVIIDVSLYLNSGESVIPKKIHASK